MARDGDACTADDVLIIQGGQQGLDLAAKLVIDPGDVIITENPTFLGALIAFNPYRAALRRRAAPTPTAWTPTTSSGCSSRTPARS